MTIDSGVTAIVLALIGLAQSLVAYLKDQWDTLHNKPAKPDQQ